MNTPPPRSWSTLLTKLGFNSKKYKSRTSANRARKLRFEQCEDRRLLAITVDVIHDIDDPNDGTTTLREALFTANSNLDHSTIHFDPTVFSTPQTIDLTEGELTIRKSVTIDAEGQGITVDASGNDPTPMLNNGDGSRVLAINMELNPEPRAVTLAGLTITGGDNSGNGGGLYFDSSAFPSGDVTLTIRDSVIEDNHSNSSGGGISLSNSTINLSNSHKLKIDILSSTIQNNSAFGAAEIFYGPNVRGGGGIYVDVDGNNDNSEGVVFNLKDSTVSGNIAQRGEGGGVWFCAKYGGTFNAINSTISGNRAQDAASSAQGGGLWISRYDNDEEPKVLANLDSTTITNNFSPDGGGLFSDSQLLKNGGQAIVTKLNNTIVSANRIALDPNSAANNIAGKIKAASSYNFIGTSTAALPTGPGNITTNNTNGIDANNPGLLPLALNGGPTRTHAPLLSSPAVNAGKPLAVAGVDNVPLHDQRGETYDRVIGGRIDIGAVEIDFVHSELGAPQVENVVISGSNSEHEAYDFAAEMLASNWIAGDQLKTVPVGGADTIAITFSEGVTIDKSFLVLAGMNLVPSPSWSRMDLVTTPTRRPQRGSIMTWWPTTCTCLPSRRKSPMSKAICSTASGPTRRVSTPQTSTLANSPPVISVTRPAAILSLCLHC